MSVMPRILRTCALLLSLSPVPGWAATLDVMVDGSSYTVTTVTGSFDDHADLLQAQIWWGDTALATSFAAAVEYDLGVLNGPVLGPFFAISKVFPAVIVPDDGLDFLAIRKASWSFLSGAVTNSVGRDVPDHV